jgi:hypothetical protein
MSIFENSFDWFDGYVELYFLCDTEVTADASFASDADGSDTDVTVFDADLSTLGGAVGLDQPHWVDGPHGGMDGTEGVLSFDASVHDAVPDYGGDIHHGPFGTTGGDGNNFYWYDRETGSSVMI